MAPTMLATFTQWGKDASSIAVRETAEGEAADGAKAAVTVIKGLTLGAFLEAMLALPKGNLEQALKSLQGLLTQGGVSDGRVVIGGMATDDDAGAW